LQNNKMLESMRARLTLWYTAILALVLTGFAVATYFYIARATSERTDASLAESADSFISSVKPELNEAGQPPSAAIKEVLSAFHFPDRQIAIFDESRRLIAESGLPGRTKLARGWPPADSFGFIVDPTLKKPGNCALLPGNNEIRVCATPLRNGSQVFMVVVAKSLHEEEESLGQVRTAFLIAIPLSLLLASIGGYLLARRSLAPVVAMGDQAARISATNLHERLPVKSERDELGRLAVTFNDLLQRLNLSFEQQRRFMADASHELRTPLAIVRGEAEVALSLPEREGGEYRESLTAVHDEGMRMSRIVEDLFTLARADAGQYPFKPVEFYIDDLINDCVRSARSLAENRAVRLRVEGAGSELLFRGDEALFSRMLMNLLDNAIKHTLPNGQVLVSRTSTGDTHVIRVEDTGAGIPVEAQPHIFERFYRADKARTRNLESDGSGAGLGLSIAQWIAELHGGRIILERSDQTGTMFAIHLPISSSLGA
jgi:heavy metal sensor kinase